MKPQDFSSSVNKLSVLITTELPVINEKMALNAAAMVKDRVINTGKDSKGTQLGDYSDNPLPLFYYEGKALNNGGRTALKKAKKVGKGLSYKEWREANNRPTDHVTLSFSGTTMKDVGVSKQLIEGSKIVTVVGAKNTKVRDNGDSTEKILDEYLGPRYSNFLQPNESEIEKLKSFLQKQVSSIIRESFRK